MSDTTTPSSQSRIPPETDPDEEQSRLLDKTLLTPSSKPLNLFRVLVRYPELMKRVNGLGGLFMAHGSLDTREREMVILRVAWNTRCDYEFAQHAPLGERIGLTQDEIRNLGDDIDQGNWNENEANLLSFADALIAEREVPDDLWEAVSGTHDSEEMMELVLLVGYYRMLASFLKTLRVPLEDGAIGLPEQ